MNDFMTCFFPSVLWQASYFTSTQPAKMCLVFMCVCLWVCVCAWSDYGLDMTDTHTSHDTHFTGCSGKRGLFKAMLT